MNIHMNRILPVFLFAAVSLSGCVTLKKVNDFSNAAAGSLQNFEKINTSATEIYVNSVRQRTYLDYSDSTLKLSVDTPQRVEDFALTLEHARRVDALLAKEYQALNGYFTGLARLSADSIANYTIDTVTASLSGGSLLDTSKISAGTIGAIGTLTTKVGAFVTNEYRIHRIKEYIVEANMAAQQVIDDMKSRLGTLHIFLEIEQLYLKDHVYQPLAKKSRSPWERKNVFDQYYRVISELQNEQQQLDNYTLCLDIIAKAHQFIKDHVDDLQSAKVKPVLSHYASLLKDGNSGFNKIKNLKQ